MKILFLFLFSTSALAQSFICHSYLNSTCELESCLFEIPGYSEPVSVLKPKVIKSIRLHLHGFSEKLDAQGNSLGPFNASYDWNNLKYNTWALAKAAFEARKPDSTELIFKSYAMESSSCLQGEMIVIPHSRGKCTTYKSLFKSPDDMSQFLDKVKSLSETRSQLPIHFSAHSGAGAVAKILFETDSSFAQSVSKVSLYDAFYQEGEAEALLAWTNSNSKKSLRVMNLAGGSPSRYAKVLGSARVLSNGSVITPIVIEKAAGLDHWQLVKQYWVDQTVVMKP
ncbi:MAG: hypothetical protein K2P81_07120 [Bacteriovoracaceae bacterium]|nr:hypothetical protein [Bacteriovoracaceae bacterium]